MAFRKHRFSKTLPLKRDLKGLYKIREGSYRIIFEVLENDQTIITHSIGHVEIPTNEDSSGCALTVELTRRDRRERSGRAIC
jgi:hypothetical protein